MPIFSSKLPPCRSFGWTFDLTFDAASRMRLRCWKHHQALPELPNHPFAQCSRTLLWNYPYFAPTCSRNGGCILVFPTLSTGLRRKGQGLFTRQARSQASASSVSFWLMTISPSANEEAFVIFLQYRNSFGGHFFISCIFSEEERPPRRPRRASRCLLNTAGNSLRQSSARAAPLPPKHRTRMARVIFFR